MSDEPTVTLELLGRQQRQLLTEMGSLRDDLGVLTAIVLRQDATMTALLTELRAIHAQHSRMNSRLRAVENQIGTP